MHARCHRLTQVDAVECSTVGAARVAHVVFEQPKGLRKALTVATKGLKSPLVCTTEGAARSKLGLKGAPLPLLPLSPHRLWADMRLHAGRRGACVLHVERCDRACAASAHFGKK